jgi:hypothetical protein
MKRLLLVLVLLGTACGKESSVKPAMASTFLRYFNGGNNDVAQAVIETSDKGLLILATTDYTPPNVLNSHSKIKLIKTDAYGNQQWQQFYPPFGGESDTLSYTAGGITLLNDGSDGIAIAGTSISHGISSPMVLTVDKEGNNPKTIKTSNSNFTGLGITQNANGEFILLGSAVDLGAQYNMVLARISNALDSVRWFKTYGNGNVSLSNKIFLDQQSSGNYWAWGGTVVNGATTAARLALVVADLSNEGAPVGNPAIGSPVFTETGNDVCRYGSSFVVIGETNEKAGSSTPGTNKDIVYNVVGSDGATVLSTHSFPVTVGGVAQDETGNSVCSTKDGGLLLLGTVNSLGTFGRGGKDYYLIKVKPSPLLLTTGNTLSSGSDASDTFGGVDWIQLYGSKFDDVGVQVIQASDGGYIVLGTTTLANLKTIMLMKIAQDGTIQ